MAVMPQRAVQEPSPPSLRERSPSEESTAYTALEKAPLRGCEEVAGYQGSVGRGNLAEHRALGQQKGSAR